MDDGTVERFVIVRSRRRLPAAGLLLVPARRRHAFRDGAIVALRGVVVAWGTYLARPGREMDDVVLLCSSGRLLRPSERR